MKYQSTCILNHRITTRSAVAVRSWWSEHEHPEVENVSYDDNGNVSSVEYV